MPSSQFTQLYMLEQHQIRDMLERFLSGEPVSSLIAAFNIDKQSFLQLLKLYRFNQNDGGSNVKQQEVNDSHRTRVAFRLRVYAKYANAYMAKHSVTKIVIDEPQKAIQQLKAPVAKVNKQERDSNIIASYASGKSAGEIAASLGMHPQSIYAVLRKNGIGEPLKQPTPIKHASAKVTQPVQPEIAKPKWEFDSERIKARMEEAHKRLLSIQNAPKVVHVALEGSREAMMIEAYKSGVSTTQLGIDYGISRVRASQILKKYGITRSDRPTVETVIERQCREVAERKDAKMQMILGCTPDEYKTLIATHGPLEENKQVIKYLARRKDAYISNQKWYFSFKTWIELLVRYNIWDENGLANGAFKVMRIHDGETPYSPQTCRIEMTGTKAPKGGRFNYYIVNDPNTHFEKLGMSTNEYCHHIAEYGDHNDPKSPLSVYLQNFPHHNSHSFNEWWEIWKLDFSPINSVH